MTDFSWPRKFKLSPSNTFVCLFFILRTVFSHKPTKTRTHNFAPQIILNTKLLSNTPHLYDFRPFTVHSRTSWAASILRVILLSRRRLPLAGVSPIYSALLSHPVSAFVSGCLCLGHFAHAREQPRALSAKTIAVFRSI